MHYQSTIVLLAVATTGINAARLGAVVPRENMERAVLVPMDNTARSVASIGGWSLAQTSAATCPVDAPACGAQWCCPGTLDCVHTGSEDIGEVCCPSTDDCTKTFTATPICADSSWNLWNATAQTSNNAGFFCCLQGQIGLQSGLCAEAADAATAGAPAVELQTGSGAVVSGSSTGSTPSTSVSVSVSTISAATSTESVTVASSTSASTSGSGSGSGSTSGSGSGGHSSGSANSAATGTGTATHTTPAGPTTAIPPPPPASSTSAVVTGKSGADSLHSLGSGAFGSLVAIVFAILIL